MCTGAITAVRTVYGKSKCSEVKVGMDKGSAFSPMLLPALLCTVQTSGI